MLYALYIKTGYTEYDSMASLRLYDTIDEANIALEKERNVLQCAIMTVTAINVHEGIKNITAEIQRKALTI